MSRRPIKLFPHDLRMGQEEFLSHSNEEQMVVLDRLVQLLAVMPDGVQAYVDVLGKLKGKQFLDVPPELRAEAFEYLQDAVRDELS